MIGGQEVVIPCTRPSVALVVATRIVMRRWPDCVIEDGSTGDELPRYDLIQFGDIRELLISKTPAASALWDEAGACDATRGTLVQLLAGRTTITVVVDDEPSSEMTAMLKELRKTLIQDLFSTRALLEAA